MKRRHVSEAAWIVGGQAATALGTIVGIRLLTQVVEPAVFGTVSLIVAAAALMLNAGCTPLTQAAIHLYPEFARRGEAAQLRAAVLRSLRSRLPWLVSIVAVGGFAYVQLAAGSIWIVVLFITLLACDCWRSLNLSLMNAAREHRRYGSWMALDAWARPLSAVAAVLILGESPIAILAAYVLVSLALAALFRDRSGTPASGPSAGLEASLWRYALPLVPLGLIGWANGLSDRYIIGGILGLPEAGIYAAAYALGSRPMLMINSTIEQALRPVYQNAVSARDTEQATRVFRLWLAAIIAICGLTVAFLSVWHQELATLLLGEKFREGSALIPWIACGYALLSVSYVFERVCYAHGQTQRVLLIQSCTAAVAVVGSILGTLRWGLAGAAAAVPVYFSVQLIVSMILARRTHLQVKYHVAAS